LLLLLIIEEEIELLLTDEHIFELEEEIELLEDIKLELLLVNNEITLLVELLVDELEELKLLELEEDKLELTQLVNTMINGRKIIRPIFLFIQILLIII
jgi:hypothetical protein